MIKKHIKLLPSLIVFGYAFYSCLLSQYTVGFRNYAGLIAGLICLLSYFFQNKCYKTFLFSTLVLGTLNILIFTEYEQYFTIYLFGIGIDFQIFSLIILIVSIFFLMPKKEEIKSIDSKQIENIKQDYINEAFETFKLKFEHKNPQELNEILKSEKYTQAAKDAAKYVLTSREN